MPKPLELQGVSDFIKKTLQKNKKSFKKGLTKRKCCGRIAKLSRGEPNGKAERTARTDIEN